MNRTNSGMILDYKRILPRIDGTAFVAETAVVIGDVEVGADTGLWYNTVVRGDVNHIRIGAGTNVQDGTVVHVTTDKFPTLIGDHVTIGHLALIHGCTLEDRCFIGMRATIMDGAVVETGAMVAAGALVTPGKRVERGQLWAGAPAKPMRDLSDEEIAGFDKAAAGYVRLARTYREARAANSG